jgi:hypothetical protein
MANQEGIQETVAGLGGAGLRRKSHIQLAPDILVRVGSCKFVDRPCFLGQTERSTKSHD